MAFDWPQTHTDPLSSELTMVRPSGLIDMQPHRPKYKHTIFVLKYAKKFHKKQNHKIYLNKHERMASPFSCDKIFVFEPSARSHKMIVPSTDDDAKTPPWFREDSFFTIEHSNLTNIIYEIRAEQLSTSGAQWCYFETRSREPNGAACHILTLPASTVKRVSVNSQLKWKNADLNNKSHWTQYIKNPKSRNYSNTKWISVAKTSIHSTCGDRIRKKWKQLRRTRLLSFSLCKNI